MKPHASSETVFAGETSGGAAGWLMPLGIFAALVSLVLLALAIVPGWAVSSQPLARFLEYHRNDLAFSGVALLAMLAVVTLTVGLSSA